ELGLVIEIDGSSHNDKQEYDAQREAFLVGLRLKVLHYSDIDILNNLHGVYANLLANIRDREAELRALF
ncbi:MAG TPA: DUF559 domain-containing protein, partial [Candidatus Kapabacteria bacterium]|nr:DUF559 domain-containing protein [Candidatus Kapabacteria bacterium]